MISIHIMDVPIALFSVVQFSTYHSVSQTKKFTGHFA